MAAVGHLIGYATGSLNLQGIWGNLLGDSQFKQLCFIAAASLIGCCGVTAYGVKERILITAK